MKNRIDLSNFNIRTDLVIDSKIEKDYLNKEVINDSVAVTTIEVNEALGVELGKKCGIYITIEFEDVTNNEDKKDVQDCLEQQIRDLLVK